MKLAYGKPNFYAVGSFQEMVVEGKKEVVKAAGFRWAPEGKEPLPDKGVWWTADPSAALQLVEYATPKARAILGKLAEKRETNLAASRATSSDINIPSPDGLEYLPFQKAGIEYALGRENTLFGDEMGLGKTMQAIGVINSQGAIVHTLVVCPAHLKINWKRELSKWLTRSPQTIEIAYANKPFPRADTIIANYDILTKFEAEIQRERWDILIVDECHYVKNPKTKRSKAVKAVRAGRRLYLTGTPIVNRPIELWPIISELDPETFNHFWNYARRYCNAKNDGFGWDLKGSSNLGELQQKLRATIMVRRLKSEVLKELPPKRRQVIEIPSNGSSKVIEAEKAAMAKQEEKLTGLKQAVEEAKASEDPEVYKAAVKALSTGFMVAFTEMAQVRHDTAVAKIPYVIDHLKEVLEAGHKVVCFAWHRDVIMRIRGGLENDRQSISQMDSDNYGSEDESGSRDVDVSLSVWDRESGIEAESGRGLFKGLSEVQTEETRHGEDTPISTSDECEDESKEAGTTVRPDNRGHSDSGSLPASRDSSQLQRQPIRSDQSLSGQNRPDKGLHKGQRVGDKLESQRNQARRQSGRATKANRKVSGKVVVVTGATPLAKRQEAVDRFQTDPNCRVFIGNLQAAGTGITLTAASHVVFAELDWVPGNVTQAEDRLHRIGAKGSVLVQHLVLEGSLDATIAKTIIRKQAVIDKALDDWPEEVEEVKNEPVIEVGEAATENTSRARIAKEAKTITQAQTEAIHEALKQLAATDEDRARMLNQIGFSKIDSNIGHSLAQATSLTPKQAALGKRIALKYSRQLEEDLVAAIKGEK